MKTVIFGVLAGLFGLGSIVSLWGIIYWHWESTRQQPVEHIEMATYEYHVWIFYLILFGVSCLVFSIFSIVSAYSGSRKGAP